MTAKETETRYKITEIFFRDEDGNAMCQFVVSSNTIQKYDNMTIEKDEWKNLATFAGRREAMEYVINAIEGK